LAKMERFRPGRIGDKGIPPKEFKDEFMFGSPLIPLRLKTLPGIRGRDLLPRGFGELKGLSADRGVSETFSLRNSWSDMDKEGGTSREVMGFSTMRSVMRQSES